MREIKVFIRNKKIDLKKHEKFVFKLIYYKKYWCTICLDGTVELEAIYKKIDISYKLGK